MDPTGPLATATDQPYARPARGVEELLAALGLVHDNYVRCGYMPPDPTGIRICIQYAAPTTCCYVGLVADAVVATVSLFEDANLGLPLDALYADVADSFRTQGRRIGEVGMLADRREDLRRGLSMLLQLMKHVFHWARRRELDELLITVNPRHVKFYRRMLCFEVCGPERTYGAVGDAPAVLLRIPIGRIKPSDAPNDHIRDLFFAPLSAEDRVPGYSMRREDLADVFLNRTDLFRHLTADQAKAIERQFPGLSIPTLLKSHPEL